MGRQSLVDQVFPVRFEVALGFGILVFDEELEHELFLVLEVFRVHHVLLHEILVRIVQVSQIVDFVVQ